MKIWNALAYEVTNELIKHDNKWVFNYWVKLIRKWCLPDWVSWKAAKTLKDVDEQASKLFNEKGNEPIYEENGLEMRLRAPWENKTE